MAQLVPLSVGDGITIYVEAAEPAVVPGQSAIQEAAAPKTAAERALDAADDLAGAIQGCCRRLMTRFRDLPEEEQPASATVEFGLNVSVEGNVYVVKGTGQSTIKVMAQWRFG
jgi:hypothetical protein